MSEIENKMYFDFKDVLIKPHGISDVSSRGNVVLQHSKKFLYASDKCAAVHINTIPIIAANMYGVGIFQMGKALQRNLMETAILKSYSQDELEEFFRSNNPAFSWWSMGTSKDDFAKFTSTYNGRNIQKINIDVANGHMQELLDTIEKTRDIVGDTAIVMAGNCGSGEQAVNIIKAGADVVKGSIGGGSVCTTRKVTGVGVPQFSWILEAVKAVEPLGGLVCSDGGCTSYGDVAKAFGAGADYVMLGGLLSGHEESGILPAIDENGNKFIEFFGSASEEALVKSGHSKSYRTSEGKKVTIPYKGQVSETVRSLFGGLRSSLSYNNMNKLEDFIGNVNFIKVTQQLNNIYG